MVEREAVPLGENPHGSREKARKSVKQTATGLRMEHQVLETKGIQRQPWAM
jgi:hypothetical protein